MTLQEQLNNDLKDALKSGDKVRVNTIRLLKSAMKYVEIEVGGQLDEVGVLAVIAKQVKQRRDSIEQFTQGHRLDLVEKESAEMAVLEHYLPAQLSPEKIESQAKAVIAELGVTDAKGTGLVMKRLMADLKNKADGKVVSEVVRKLLAKS